MTTVNATNYTIDQTVRIFDQFYNYSANIPTEEYDAVLSYFKSVMTTVEAAENFTSSLFRVAEITNTDALTLLQTFQQNGSSEPQVTILMAYYLNGVRSTSTLLGVLSPTTPNFYTARNIRA
jgi:S-adenosylmethionine hydrolase